MEPKHKVTLSYWKFNAILRTMDYDECDALGTSRESAGAAKDY
jgi:hypothetical protein